MKGSNLNSYQERISNLSPEKRAILMLRLREKNINTHSVEVILPRKDKSIAPMSCAQESLWFLQSLSPDSTFYNIPGMIKISGPLNIRALMDSFFTILNRHDIMRANFPNKNGAAVQRISTNLDTKLRIIDLEPLDRSRRIRESENLIINEFQKPFNISKGPLVRIKLIRFNRNEHYLLFVMHHLIADGWSVKIVINEFTHLYETILNKKKPSLPNLEIQYPDFAKWQQDKLVSKDFKKQLSYWKSKLNGMPSVLEFPKDFPRPVVPSHRGSHIIFYLSENISAKLNVVARDELVSLFMIFLTAYEILLYRYSGQEDFGIGIPIANRTHKEFENLIGLFVNTVVLRAQLSTKLTFRQLLHSIKKSSLEAFENQEYPFDKLVEVIMPDRKANISPLFQVMFDFQEAPVFKTEISGLKFTLEDIERNTSKFDLMLSIEKNKDKLKCIFEYSKDLFEDNTISRMAGHYQSILARALDNLDKPIGQLSIITEEEKNQFLLEFNQPYSNTFIYQNIVEAFEAQVFRTPKEKAIVYETQSITYLELNKRANQIANLLIESGVQTETYVGLFFSRSIDQLVCLMGILKAGCAYLPLDSSYPIDRLQLMLRDAGAQIILTNLDSAKELNLNDLRIINLNSEQVNISNRNILNPKIQIDPENIAYIIYTSGSTGQPKGVMIKHRAVINLLDGLNKSIFNNSNNDLKRVSLNAALTFDASVQQLVHLLTGRTLYVLPQEIRGDGTELLAFVARHKLDILDCVPSQLKIMLEAGLLEQGNWSPNILLPGGEAIDLATWKILAQAENTETYNMYGPTECTVDSSSCRVKSAPERPNIGRPLHNMHLYVLNGDLELQPIGVSGELYIGGEGLARGYLNKPELTAEKFIPNPFSKVPGGRIYKTGDLVRFRPDGNIEFLGRTDNQIKLRGFRIELGEIESAILKNSNIKETAVLVREIRPGDERLVAYIIPSDTNPPDKSELKESLYKYLPDYMIPATFIILEAFPLTPNGKVDCKKLPLPDEKDFISERYFSQPKNSTEELLVNIWSEVLGLERISVIDNFFEIGGHSLLATKVILRIRKTFQIELPLRTIFEASTIRELAKVIEDSIASKGNVLLPPIKPVDKSLPIPLSFAQERLWFLEQLESGNPFYNIPIALQLTGRLNESFLEESLNEIVRRHAILRTSFHHSKGKPNQVIAKDLKIKLKRIDLQAIPSALVEDELQYLRDKESQNPFSLASVPLFRVMLLKLDENEYVILFTIHHIIFDGWSTNILLRELTALYNSLLSKNQPNLPELNIQYADYAYWQRKWLKNSILENQLNFWKESLHGYPQLLSLPTDRPRPSVQSFRGDQLYFEISKELTYEVRKLAQQQGVTLFMMLLSAFDILLYRYSGQNDLCVGTPIANRNRAEIENLIGFFSNTLVLRSNLSGNPTFKEFLKQVSKTAIDSYAHQDLPFEKLVNEIRPERDLSHSPLFQVMFVLEKESFNTINFGSDLTLSLLKSNNFTSKFDLTLALSENGDNFSGFFEYNIDLFNKTTIKRFSEHFKQLLTEIVKNKNQHIEIIPILTEEERNLIVSQWNRIEKRGNKLEKGKCIHELFEEQVEQNPYAIAVILNNESITYKKLNERANQLAHLLRKLGVDSETLVGICLERSLEMIVAIIGILKAGGAYVPLDVNYPKERLQYLALNSDISVLLTQNHLYSKLANISPKVVFLDPEGNAINKESVENPVNYTSSDNLAYVIYTSGSTGWPKGVQVEHKGVTNFVNYYIKIFKVSVNSRILQFFSSSFDGSVADIFMALLSGATLVLVDEENRTSDIGLMQILEQRKVTIAILAPSLLAILPSDRFPDLKIVGSGGEATTKELVARWARGRKYFNVYGPTEASVLASTYLTNEMPENAINVPIGRPINNIKMFILNPYLQLVPMGVAGEIYIGGVGLARGYLNRPDLTAEKFIPDPFSQQSGSRLYKTGDLAKYLPDGNIEYLGRIDNQVKIRGFRIELGEIETALKEYPTVGRTVVIVRKEDGNKRLVAYIVPEKDNKEINIDDIRKFLKKKLPDYMIPSAFMVLNSLPLTPNGKIDIKALPVPEFNRSTLTSEYIEPRNTQEEILANIWQEILNIQKIGIHDNFFELGGDSILSIQVIAQARQAGLNLTPKNLFENPTIDGLARVAGEGRVIAIDQNLVSGDVPLTPIQHWFFEQKFIEPSHWNQSVLLNVNGELDASVLKEAIETIILHHDILRVRYRRTEQSWEQYILLKSDELPVHSIDMAALNAKSKKEQIEVETERLQGSLNILEGPIFRVAHFSMGKRESDRLLIVIHHLAVDGISWRVLLEDIQSAYKLLSQNKPVQLPPKTVSFKKWSELLTEYAQSEKLKTELDHWLSLLDKNVSDIPADFESTNNFEHTVSIKSISLNVDETFAFLHEINLAYQTLPNDILLTALLRALAKWSGQRKVLIDLEGHGRENVFDGVDISRTIGWFTTIYPVLLDLTGTYEIGQEIVAVKEQLRKIPNNGFGYGLLRYLAKDESVRQKFAVLPKADIVFNYLGQFDQLIAKSKFNAADEHKGSERHPLSRQTHKISISGKIINKQLQLDIIYSRELYKKETIENFAKHYISELRSIILYCLAPDSGGYTPSDFQDVELAQDEVENLLKELSEDIT